MFKLIITILGCYLLCISSALADTVYFKAGNTKKGIVLKEYTDRIIFKDLEGEHIILLDDIKNIERESEEQNLLSLGNKLLQEKKYEEALKYYEAALRLNPNSKDIQDAILRVRGILFRQKDNFQQQNLERFKKLDQLQKKYQSKRPEIELPEHKIDYSEQIQSMLGFSLEKKSDEYEITNILSGSSASEAKMLVGDKIIAVWGGLIKFESLESIYEKLISGPKYSDVKLRILRRVVVLGGNKFWFFGAFNIIDSKLKFVYDGLIIYDIKKEGRSDLAGLKEKDLVLSINGVKSDYLTIDNIKEKLIESENSKIEFIILRDVILRRR